MRGRFGRIVRCDAGHLFTTTWIPLVSFKAIRLGTRRYQRCPVGHHFAAVEPVDEAELSAAELAAARAVHDVRIPWASPERGARRRALACSRRCLTNC